MRVIACILALFCGICLSGCSPKGLFLLNEAHIAKDSLRASLPPIPSAPVAEKKPMAQENVFIEPIDPWFAEVLEEKKENRRLQNTLQGYTLQLYKGWDRNQAQRIQRRWKRQGYQATLQYKQPHYFVSWGFFSHILQAHASAYIIQRQGGNAIILPTQTPLDSVIKDAEK